MIVLSNMTVGASEVLFWAFFFYIYGTMLAGTFRLIIDTVFWAFNVYELFEIEKESLDWKSKRSL